MSCVRQVQIGLSFKCLDLDTVELCPSLIARFKQDSAGIGRNNHGPTRNYGKEKVDLSCLSFRQMALALGVDEDTLRKMHEQGGDCAPPRFRISGNRWAYPIYKYRQWLERRINPNEAA